MENQKSPGLPPAYSSASWRNTTPVDPSREEIGLAFNLADGNVLRLRLDLASARSISETLRGALAAMSDSLAVIPPGPELANENANEPKEKTHDRQNHILGT